MLEGEFIRNLGFIVVAAAVFAVAGRAAKIPTIVLYIFAGLVLGPVTGIIEVTDALHLIAEVGIALLLFVVGLELSLDKIRDVGRVAIVAGIGQVVFTAAGGFILCILLGFSVMESIFLGTALTFSSTVVVVKLLDQKKELNSLYGRIAVGIFLVQDLVVIIALTFLAGLRNPGEADWTVLTTGVVFAFLGMAVLLGAVMLASRYLLPRLFAWASRSAETIFIWSLCWCFLVVTGAEVLQLSLEIGAFLAGISLAQLPYNQDLRRRVHPLMSFFIAVFFVSLGIQMELAEALLHWQAAVVLSLFVLIGNPFIFIWIIVRMGYSEKTSFKTSVTVAQISEFSFIFAAMGVGSGLIGSEILSLTASVGIVTIVISAYMILYNDGLYAFCRRLGLLRMFGAKQEEEGDGDGRRSGHVIVVGMNDLGRRLVERLCSVGEKVLAIDTDPGKLEGLPCETMMGSVEYPSLLEEAGFAHARLVVSALQIEDTNNMLVYRCKKTGIPSGAHAFDLSLIEDLVAHGAIYILTPKVDGLIVLVEALKKKGLVRS